MPARRLPPPAARPLGLLLGMAADALLGDPARWHPVAGFGRAASVLEREMYRDSRLAGAWFAAASVALVAGLGRLAPQRVAWTAAATWSVVGGRSLRAEATAIMRVLERGDLAAARARLPHLCGRDAAALDTGGVARAVVESVAENTSDAVVAPLLWGAVGGVPGLLAYRAVNTLDAMVGHRDERYARFGWASARLDDAMNWVPARVAAVAAVITSPNRARAWRTWRRDGAAHPSPNAGQVEAAFAGALGVRLGGELTYALRVEHRPELGDGPRPEVADIDRAVRLSRRVSVCATIAAATLATVLAAVRTRRVSR